MQRDYNGYKDNTFQAKIYFSLIKSNKNKLALTSFYYLEQWTWLGSSENVPANTNQNSEISYIWEIQKPLI